MKGQKTMSERLTLGAAVGAITSFLCWNGNRTPHLVSTFPDGLAFIALAALIFGAVWFHVRRSKVQDEVAVYKASATIAGAGGIVFGTFVVFLGAARFSKPLPGLLVFGFLTAFGSSLVCGALAAALAARLVLQRNHTSGAA
jgi:hypothetical protein